jgi:hypothetical protein
MVAVDTSLLDEAVAFVRAAGDLTLEWFRNDALTIEHKGDGTPRDCCATSWASGSRTTP